MGRVHAIACLVGGKAWAAPWPARLRRLGPERVDVGLHLDLTELPLRPGSRRTLPWLIASCLLRRLDPRAVRAEIRAQLDRFEQLLGREPAFVDGHQHVHQLPVVRTELLDELASRYGSDLPWLRCTHAAVIARRSTARGWGAWLKPCGIELLGSRALSLLARSKGMAQNRRLLGVYDFQGGPERYRGLLADWIATAGDADLLVCHPSARVRGGDPLIDARRAEFQMLCSTAFELLRVEAGLRLAPMSRILADARRSG
jgi:predicted glycoside hydrolase/deacetylase ChbG (UPF0249 family)